MKFKLDENLPTELAADLRTLGHDAETVLDEGLRVYRGSTDQNGDFRIAGLAPGDYYINAWQDLEN